MKAVNLELSSLAIYDLSDHVSKQKRANRLSKFKTIQKIETTKNEISSHIDNSGSICRVEKLQNEKHFLNYSTVDNHFS